MLYGIMCTLPCIVLYVTVYRTVRYCSGGNGGRVWKWNSMVMLNKYYKWQVMSDVICDVGHIAQLCRI